MTNRIRHNIGQLPPLLGLLRGAFPAALRGLRQPRAQALRRQRPARGVGNTELPLLPEARSASARPSLTRRT